MKLLKLTLIGVLAVCFTCPAMGYQPKKKAPKKLARTEGSVKSGKNAGQPKVFQQRLELKVVKVERTGQQTIKNELERKIAQFTKETKQKMQATQPQPQSADFCEKNCRPLNDDEMYEAELKLQHLRETTDPTASFEKYPELMYEHSDACKYHQKQTVPTNGTEKAAKTPAEK